MSADLQRLFRQLRDILQKHAPGLHVARDAPDHYGLEASPGATTLRAWGGQRRRTRIPVAWVEIRKTYVSYHLMSLDHPKVRGAVSKQLAARMLGKTCFTFKTSDEAMLRELAAVTEQGLTAFREAGFIADRESA